LYKHYGEVGCAPANDQELLLSEKKRKAGKETYLNRSLNNCRRNGLENRLIVKGGVRMTVRARSTLLHAIVFIYLP